MKAHRIVSHFLIIFVCIAVGTGVSAIADWQVGGPCKMHYPQLPDPDGWDVALSSPQLLADDFLCTEDGPITNIHLWVSWFADQVGTITNIHLSIHGDTPMPNPAGYSYPSNLLWEVNMTNGFSIVPWGVGEQGWFEPPAFYEQTNHYNIWQINITNFEAEEFFQTSGTVYWLDVQVNVEGGAIGWKTSETNWNDDAVFWDDTVPWQWTEMTNPVPPYESLDMAFVIDGGYPEPEPEETNFCAKWSQPPDCDIGVDVESWAFWEDGHVVPGPFKVADDWLCDGRPVVGAHWWGSYIGWETNNADPTLAPPGNRPMGFNVTWYTDVPATATEFSRPGAVLATNYYPLESYMDPTNYVYAPGVVYETTSCVSHFAFYDPNLYEHEYDYWLTFPVDKIWNEKEGQVYWLSIEAVYLITQPPSSNLWGWKTTPPQWDWNDDAVQLSGITNEMIYPPPGWEYMTNHPYKGLSANMAYELLTDVCPSRCKKWAQPPDMWEGQDMQSWRTNGGGGILRADDFVSDGRPITDIHWWGSYLNWMQSTPGSVTSPVPYPTNALERPLGFNLSWHAHDPVNCHPTNVITNIFVAITNCHEVYYGSVTQFWVGEGNYEHEYQYYVNLLDPEINAPWYETNGVHYWLNIQAVFPVGFNPDQARHDGWGWKITPQENNFGCFSVFSTDTGTSWRSDTVGTDGGSTHPRAPENFDLAFELTTTEMPWYTNAVVAGFTNMARAPVGGNLYLWSTGHCGCGKQILQESTNLTQGGVNAGWVDVWTNPHPTPQNLWWGQPVTTTRFYRIKQVP